MELAIFFFYSGDCNMRKAKYNVKEQIERIITLREKVEPHISELEQNEHLIPLTCKPNKPFSIFHEIYVQETTEVLKDIIAYEKYYLKDLPTVLRANDSLYYLAFQDKGRFCGNLELLIKDILEITKEKKHPLYCKCWRNMLLLLEHILWDSEDYFYDKAFKEFKEFISKLEQRAKKQGLVRSEEN